MDDNSFFCHLTSEKLAEFIASANNYVCYAGPGIQLEPALSLSKTATEIGAAMITVSIDFSENTLRMGYGDVQAVKILRDADIQVTNSPSLRIAFVIVDGQGYSFTPTALYLEAEEHPNVAINAIRLSELQVREALARLSPAAKAIAIAQATTPEEEQAIAKLSLEVESKPVIDGDYGAIKASLDKIPPTKFDLARQVRVYNALIQYVDLKLTGAAIQKRRVQIPRKLQRIGGSEDLEGRIHTTFDLIERDGKFSSKALERELSKIRELARPLGKEHGRVLRKEIKETFQARIEEFRAKLQKHQQDVESGLQTKLDKSKDEIIKFYIPQIQNSPPEELIAQSNGGKVSKELAKSWLEVELDRVFPSADSLVGKMSVDVTYKDVTYETLKNSDFLEALNKAYPHLSWDMPLNEFNAAEETEGQLNLGGI